MTSEGNGDCQIVEIEPACKGLRRQELRSEIGVKIFLLLQAVNSC
jgi:hypothetical protein